MNRKAFRFLLRRTGLRMAGPLSACWRDFSHLALVGDEGGWVLDEEIRDLRATCRRLGLQTSTMGWEMVSRRQCVFFASQFVLLNPPEDRGHRMCFAYFHGKPGTGPAEFDEIYSNLRKTRDRWARIQVSHSEMREIVLSTGIAPDKVHVIPIAIRIDMFSPATTDTRTEMRRRLNIPKNAFVVGSFQKDGNGWDEGLEPKLIKGPDVLVETLRALKPRIPELFVFLCGPARGYVKQKLTELCIPFRHVFTKHYKEIPPLYHTLDVCLVTSRQEGGPKAVLESMASGIPLVTTRVGQSMDLVRIGENGFMVGIEDVKGLADSVERLRELGKEARQALLWTGRVTAEENAWDRQDSLWRDFFAGVLA